MEDGLLETKAEEAPTGRELNKRWNVGARQALYRENGTWYHLLEHFPGALFDANGYILFKTQQEYEKCEHLQRGKELGVPRGIASIPGYVAMMVNVDRERGNGSLDLDPIIVELSRRAAGHPFGDLQTIRAEIKGRPRPKPESARRIFGRTHRDPGGDYVFHFGGGSEFQFNIGLESNNREIRHGIAFSLEPSRNKPWPELQPALLPKVKLFNEFMDLNAGLFSDMRMWHAENKVRVGSDEMPGPIPWERMKKGVFVFLGKRQGIDNFGYDAVLEDLGRLLTIYQYVESGGATQPTSMPASVPFLFSPSSWSDKASSTVATPAQIQLDVVLRHNEMQKVLYHRLVSEYGDNRVSFENNSGVGTRVDIVVRRENEYWFYEIKTAQSPRACLREAIGQLLEYAFWPGAPKVTRLIIVGEAPIDKDGAEYLRRLREHFSLPFEYEAVQCGSAAVRRVIAGTVNEHDRTEADGE